MNVLPPTIETGPIWKALTEEAQVIFDYWVKCPGCGERHVMTFDQIKWNKEQDRDGKEIDPDPERVETLGLAWYECPHCHCQWDDGWRDRAVKAGEFRGASPGEWLKAHGADSGEQEPQSSKLEAESPRELFAYLQAYRPKKIGFHLPSWISPFVSLSKVAAAYLKGKKDIQARRDFYNAHKAEPYKPKISVRKEDDILALRDDRERGVVPAEPIVGLTGVADTQDDGFWYEVRAWGPWEDQESWQITEGFAPSVHPKDFHALERIFFEDIYRDMDGNEYPVQLIFIDTGGHRTGEVYDWCRTHYPRVMGLRGHDRMPKAWRWNKPGEKHRKKGRDIPLIGLNVNHYKDMLANRLMIPPQNPGAWHLHKETTVEWAKQMCAETRDPDTGLWVPSETRANHAWDIATYFVAMADIYLKRWPVYEPGKNDHAEIAGSGKRRGIKVARSQFMSG
jgi:phage terminase large subunit GpA-like protein